METLSLEWSFSLNRAVGAANLCDADRSAIFYVSAHAAVIHDLTTHKQTPLSAHANNISAAKASPDKKVVLTADAGPESILVAWDTHTAQPIATVVKPHAHGVAALDVSADARFVVTLSDGPAPQELSLWSLVDGESELVLLHSAQVGTVDEPAERQLSVRFDPASPQSIVSNGAALVIFWEWDDESLTYYAPPLAERSTHMQVDQLTSSVFVPGTTRAASATADGHVLVWEHGASSDSAADEARPARRAAKLVKLHAGAIHVIETLGNLIVTGGADGHVRVFDADFKILAWYEDLDAGPVTSVSFAHESSGNFSGFSAGRLRCPDFVVTTASSLIVSCQASMFDEVSAEDRRGKLLVQGQDAPVHGLAAHHSLPRFACAGYSGLLQLWDYEERRLLLLRMFEHLQGHALAFSPGDGELLACGFTNGTIKIMGGSTLHELASFRHSRSCITHVAFSASSEYFASACDDRAVAVYRRLRSDELEAADPGDGSAVAAAARAGWELVGRQRAHAHDVVDLTFGGADGEPPRLFSVGSDRRVVEYDLELSSVADGLQLRASAVVEHSAKPTACFWLGDEEQLVVANDAHKLRHVAVHDDRIETLQKVLGPTYSGPVVSFAPVAGTAGGDGPQYVAYATSDKVIGLLQLPLDGNPNRGMGLIAHPGEVSALAATYDGRYLITAGGDDLAIHMWRVNTEVLDQAVVAGGSGIAPFEAVLEGGREGDFYSEMVDYFYYVQLRVHGEDSILPRRIDGRVPVSELGSLMRALGAYLSEFDVAELESEAAAVAAAAGGGVSFDDFLRLYVNHRPVEGVSEEAIAHAFAIVLKASDGAPRDTLLRALLGRGERLSKHDLDQCLQVLVGEAASFEKACPEDVDAARFARELLGFN